MNNQDIVDFKNAYENDEVKNYVKLIEEEDAKPENYNVFKILGLSDYEIRHSNFLAWLLNNRDKEFLLEFIRNCNLQEKIKEEDLVNIEINREEFFVEIDEVGNPIYRKVIDKEVVFRAGEIDSDDFYTLERKKINGRIQVNKVKWINNDLGKERYQFTKTQRYIDINIVGENFTLTIENKIDTGEHDYQCRAYRNYVLNKYNTKKEHYFVYLAKRKPEDFDISDDLNGIYPEYRFIDYRRIKEILERMKEKRPFADRYGNLPGEVVEQYINIISEWEKMQKGYKDILADLDLADFADNKKFNDMINSNLSYREKRFVHIARQFYFEKKKLIDDIIKPSLKELSKDSDYIMESYGRGNYANAIPISINALSDKERETYYEKKGILGNKEEIAKIKEEKKDIKIQNLVFQTVDYRAPREGIEYPSIAIIAGLKTDYSKNLIKKIKDKDFLKRLCNKKQETNWKIELKNYYKNGSRFKVEYEISWNIDKISELSAKDKKTIFDKDRVKGYTADDIFSKDFWDYIKLVKDKELCENLPDWVNSIRTYFIVGNGTGIKSDNSEPNSIERSLNAINKFWGKYKDYKDKFDAWLEKQSKSEVDIADINGLLGKEIFEEKDKTIIKRLRDIDDFKRWIKENKSESRFKKVINEYIKNNGEFDLREHKMIYLGWNLSLVYVIEDEIIKKLIVGNYDNDDDYEADKAKIKETLKEIFLRKTIEGVEIFGNMPGMDCTYVDWFKEVVFKV